jgi:hypothetical protein
VTINMRNCIFCLSTTGAATHEEHILPESLGGERVLTHPLVCNQCNAYFGAKVEEPALSSPLLTSLRAFFCLPNKRGRYARYRFDDMILSGTPFGIPFLHVQPERAETIFRSETGLRIPFDFTHKGSIVRMLLKIALECIAESTFNVFDKRFDPARIAARRPARNHQWPLAYSFGSLQEEDVIFEDAKDGTLYKWELREHPTESTMVFELFFFVTETLLCMLIVPVTLEGDFRAQVQQLNEGNPTVIPFTVESVHLNNSPG